MASRASREASWSSMHHSEVSDEESEAREPDRLSVDEESEAEGRELHFGNQSQIGLRNIDAAPISPTPQTFSDVRRTLHPLRATAERVGKQVEKFAEHLDRYNEQRTRSKHKDCRNVLPLVNHYKRVANATVDNLRVVHSSERQRSSSGGWIRRLRSSGGRVSSVSSQADEHEFSATRTTVKDLKTWEQEEQTWELLASMLQVEYPVPSFEGKNLAAEQQQRRPGNTTEVHRFSSEKEAWDRFLGEDDLAWERHTVLEWLKNCADNSGQDIETVVQELEAGADRDGLEAHSWMYSSLEIKKQKRLRAWPQALDPDSPGVDLFLTDSGKSKDLVTQLDPDAMTRQGRHLESQDFYNERAIWLACWEMVRRGKDWNYIHDWCQERGEGWRATAMRGDPQAWSAATTSLANGWQSRALWRSICAMAAKHGGVDKYENAIYGALGGYLPSIMKVCGSWNDFLYAHYNSYLLAQFDNFVKERLPERVPPALAMKIDASDFKSSEDHRRQSGKEIVDRMKKLESTQKQATTLPKLLQGSLIAKAFDEFVVQQGARLGQSANAPQKSKIMARPRGQAAHILDSSETAPITLHDHEMLRVITHMLFVFQDLGLAFEDADCLYAAENIIVAYIDFLGKAGKLQLLPLYASRLSPARATDCLARQLPLIQEHTERQTVMSLMEQSGIDVPGVLMMQLMLIISDAPERSGGKADFPQLEILEPIGNNVARARPIKEGFIGISISEDEQNLVSGFEWFSLLVGHWQLTMNMGTLVYKHFLRYGALAAGRALSDSMSFSKISLSKTKRILGSSIDLNEGTEGGDEETLEDDGYDSTAETSNQSKTDRGSLLSQARSFRQLEHLFYALDALDAWKGEAKQIMARTDLKSRAMTEAKQTLKQHHVEVEATVQSLLQGWLQSPKDEDEAAEFEGMRRACLPEVVLAYTHVLEVGARFISRDLLLDSMDLAAMIAGEESDVASCFIDTGSMAELVTAFAFASQSIIRAEEAPGGTGKSKRKMDGKTLGIWTTKVGPQ